MIAYKLISSLRKTLAIELNRNGELIVKAPLFLPRKKIEQFIIEKEKWIIKKQNILTKTNHLQNGDQKKKSYLYLGETYQIKINKCKQISFGLKEIQIPDFLQFRINKEIRELFLNKAKEIITGRVKHYERLMKINAGRIKFSDTKSKWGTCKANNDLQFNWRLIGAPLLVIDYVVVHELAHVLFKNHSRDFWRMVEKYKPAYRQFRKWLKTNSGQLNSF